MNRYLSRADAGRRRGAWRIAGYAALFAVLAIAFLAYRSPGMRLSWESVAALCGF